ncbi:AMP-binding protein [Sphingobacteriaceae bacterium WQ 2009]|uniref:AMP-binding protein n=1 Tax=Rhinopithecimicrobium faecis TaxID=2820698 RepID=A0A8T4HBT8_9SPHI|nr:AMP-binding protein [Sphingobacteriaceae bacterium WQ 2009]
MRKEWINEYEPGVKTEINTQKYNSIADLFKQAVLKYPRSKAYTYNGTSLNYVRSHKLAKQLATYLQHLGLQKGDRIALMLPNTLPYPIAIFAALQVGIIVVNINPEFNAAQAQAQLKDSEAKAIIIFENYAHLLQEIRYNLPLKHIIVVDHGDLQGPIKRLWINTFHRFFKKNSAPYTLPNKIKFQKAILLGRSLPRKSIEILGNDIAFIQYGPDTGNKPKGAMLTHRNILGSVQQLHAFLQPSLLHSKMKNFISPLPLFMNLSLLPTVMLALTFGANTLLINKPKLHSKFISLLNKKKYITLISGFNSFYKSLIAEPNFAKLNFKTWIVAFAGGSSIQVGVAKRWQEITGTPITQGYGLTEACSLVSINPFNHKFYKESIGIPLPNTNIQIRGFHNEHTVNNDIGELYIQGPQVMKGYWQQPELTKENLSADGWLATGDIVRIDKRGYLYYIKRKSQKTTSTANNSVLKVDKIKSS